MPDPEPEPELTLTANANNIINVIAIVDNTGSFSIQVCDTVVLPYSG